MLRVEGPGPCSIWAKQGHILQHTDFSCIVHWAQLYILMDRMGPLTPDLFCRLQFLLGHVNDVCPISCLEFNV